MFKRHGIRSGLGDRLGNYLMYAMMGELLNVDIYTTWIYETLRYGERGDQYPNNIEEYISFPKRLKFVSQDELNNLNIPSLNYRWVYHGFDYIPETLYKSLIEDKNINCTFDEMINMYKKVCKELYYKKNLPIEINNRPGMIHLRRGDKGNNVNHNDKILNLVNKYNTVTNWIITSDSQIPNILIEKIPNILYPKWSTDNNIRTLEEFFAYSYSSIIIQSVNLQNDANGSGWAGYSYVAFQIGLSKFEENSPILISCNIDEENTRLTYAKKYAERELKNIYMYNNIFHNIMDKVSVIIPTYNRFKYVLNTIQSVKEQTYSNIEIIVVNDNSTQKEYYEYEWEKNNIKIIHLEKNSKTIFGYACAGYVRNKGIEISCGKYIAFCDDDDIWFPNKIKLQIKAIQDSGCKMSSTDGLIGNGIYDSTKKYNKYNAEYYYNLLQNIYKNKCSNLLDNGFPNIWNLDFLKIHNCIICSSVVIEKTILDKINNMKCINNAQEDYDCWLRALQHTDSIYVNDICFYYDNGHGDGQNY